MRKTIASAYALSLVVCTAPAWSAGTDELWEISQKMNMPGMAMPAMKIKSCIAKDGNYKPGNDPGAKDCVVDDYKVAGNTVTWKLHCTGKNAMTGSGEMTKTADTMKGTFKMATGGMEMTQTMDGKRVGTCDAGEEKKKTDKMVADSKAQAEQSIKQGCEDTAKREAESGGTGQIAGMFNGKGQCVAQKAQLCDQARAQAAGYEGYAHYVKARENAKTTHQQWGWVVSECGIDLEKQRLALYEKAVAEKRYGFIGAYCPDEAKAMYAKNCAGFGMDYTADMAKPNAKMCYALRSRSGGGDDGNAARAGRGDSQEKAAATENKPADTASSKLKKLFGF
jgi:hypothetical protein